MNHKRKCTPATHACFALHVVAPGCFLASLVPQLWQTNPLPLESSCIMWNTTRESQKNVKNCRVNLKDYIKSTIKLTDFERKKIALQCPTNDAKLFLSAAPVPDIHHAAPWASAKSPDQPLETSYQGKSNRCDVILFIVVCSGFLSIWDTRANANSHAQQDFWSAIVPPCLSWAFSMQIFSEWGALARETPSLRLGIAWIAPSSSPAISSFGFPGSEHFNPVYVKRPGIPAASSKARWSKAIGTCAWRSPASSASSSASLASASWSTGFTDHSKLPLCFSKTLCEGHIDLKSDCGSGHGQAKHEKPTPRSLRNVYVDLPFTASKKFKRQSLPVQDQSLQAPGNSNKASNSSQNQFRRARGEELTRSFHL